MILFFFRFKLIPALAIAEGKFGYDAHSGEQVKCAVDSGQSHSWISVVEGNIDFFSIHVFR